MRPFYMVSLADTLSAGMALEEASQENLLDIHSLTGMVGWVGIAQLADLTTNDISLSGSAGCRLLLQKMLTTLNIEGRLDDSHFPYRVLPLNRSTEKTTYFVSFSHSHTSVAVLLANQPRLGIDIEKRPISTAIAQRYFSPAESAWLDSLPISRQPVALTLLWTLKESRIKSQTDSQLFNGIGHDILTEIGLETMPFLLDENINSPSRSRLFYFDNHDNNAPKTVAYQLIGFDRVQQCGWWINFFPKNLS